MTSPADAGFAKWSAIDVGNATTYTIQGLTQGVTYYIALTAYDSADNESDFSNEVSGTITETVTAPNVINGPTSGTPGQSCAFTAGGSSSSLGHTVEYQFDWYDDGDHDPATGSLSEWSVAPQGHAWLSADDPELASVSGGPNGHTEVLVL